MKIKFIQIVTLAFLAVFQVALAQQTVSGTVTDADGLPLPGATVVVKGTSTATSADFDGNYTIAAANGNVLVVSYVGYNAAEVTVNGATANVSLSSSTALDEVVVVGYGSLDKKSLVHAVETVDSEELEKIQATSITQALQGTVSGVTVLTTGGVPGADQTIRIRGIGSINASASPLIIVDGAIWAGGLNSIPQEQVESISVLKDASAAIYGSRGANGVIIVNTKKGKKNSKGTFTFSTNHGSQSEAVDIHKVLDTDTFSKYFFEAVTNNNQYVLGDSNADARAKAAASFVEDLGYNPYGTGSTSPIDSDGNLIGAPLWNTNWYNALVNQNPRRVDHNITYLGGSEKTNYFFGVNYLHQEGQVKTTWFDRFSLRSNIDTEVTDKFSMGLTMSFNNTVSNTPNQAGSGFSNVIQWIYTLPSYYPLYERNPDGSFVLDAAGNKVYDYGSRAGLVNGSRTILTDENAAGALDYYKFENNSYNFNASSYMNYKISDKLNFKTTLVYGRDSFDGFSYVHYLYGYASSVGGRVSQDRNIVTTVSSNQQFSYSDSFGKSSINIDAIYENYALKVSSVGAQGVGFLPNVTVLNGSTTPEGVSGAVSEERLESFITRLRYNYAEKYFFEGSYRRDGSTRFAKDVRWGDFFSLAGSWVVSNEDFFDVDGIDFLKLRYSYGEVGNNRGIGYFPYMQLFSTGWNNLENTGVLSQGVVDPMLSWEKTAISNLGLEFNLLDDKISGSLDYYTRESIDLIYDKPLAISTGNASITTNVGSIKNSGVELTLNANNVIDKENLKLDLGFNITTNENEITELTQEEFINGTKKWMVGKSLYHWFIREWAGVDPADGYGMWYKDILDAEGNPTGERETTKEYGEATRYYIDDKTSLPKYTGGFNANLTYKNFDFSTLVYFSLGSYQYDSEYAGLMGGFERNEQGHPDLARRWQKPGDITDVPLLLNASNDFNATSTRFLYKNDWARVKAITIGYNFSDEVNNKLKTESFRIFLQGDNLFTITGHDGIDPEQTLSGTTNARSSLMRTISLGLNIKL